MWCYYICMLVMVNLLLGIKVKKAHWGGRRKSKGTDFEKGTDSVIEVAIERDSNHIGIIPNEIDFSGKREGLLRDYFFEVVCLIGRL